MQLIRGLHNLNCVKSQLASGCVLTIGNFDGVHLGHKQVLQAVTVEAKKYQLPSVVMLFEPLPIEYFLPKKAPVRLMNFREKICALQLTEVDYVLCVRFNTAFSELTAANFVQQILLQDLRVKHLVVGDDFKFGKQRQGNYAYLQESGRQYNFRVSNILTYDVAELRVSSTRIRSALNEPNLPRAEALLGEPFKFNGRVIHGQKLGRTLGFRTLNLNPKRIQIPILGVFAVSVGGIADKPLPGVANLGLRSTVDGMRPLIEVHLLNWNEDVYGKYVDVTLEQFIRSEIKFDNIDALKTQITLDVEVAKHFFNL